MGASGLEGFIEEVTGESHLRVEEDFGGGFVRLRMSEADRRQAQQDIRGVEDIVLELLRNSRDAGARMICVATNRDGATRNIVVLDDGEGIPPEMQERVFEPRVTSRLDSFHADQWGVHGRGMALFSIACNSTVHKVAKSGIGKGSAIQVVADTTRLSEKADQSTIPHLVIDDNGRKVVRGPRNINRIVTEFTLAQKSSCLVYLGSPNEVIATLVAYGQRVLSAVEMAFPQEIDEYPICLQLAIAATPEELTQIANSLGMTVSTRSARRILDGQIEPLQPFVRYLNLDECVGKQAVPRKTGLKSRPIRMEEEDLAQFVVAVKAAYGELAQGYYLEPDIEPDIRITREGMRVFIPFA